MIKKLCLSILLVFMLFFIGFHHFYLILEVIPSGNSKAILAVPVSIGNTFIIRFTHSVQKTPVDEIFTIKKDLKMVLNETIYSSYGAGLPSEIYGSQKFFLENGQFIIRGIDKEFDEIPIFVGAVIANHTLILGDREFSLVSFGLAGKSVRIRLNHYSVLSYIIKYYL